VQKQVGHKLEISSYNLLAARPISIPIFHGGVSVTEESNAMKGKVG